MPGRTHVLVFYKFCLNGYYVYCFLILSGTHRPAHYKQACDKHGACDYLDFLDHFSFPLMFASSVFKNYFASSIIGAMPRHGKQIFWARRYSLKNPRSDVMIAAGLGGQPGMWSATGRIVWTGPAT